MDRHRKYTPGSLMLARQLDADGKVATIWGGQVLQSGPKELTLLAIEMQVEGVLDQNYQWHCVGEFQTIKAPPHREPYQWDFPRLLVEGEASEFDLRAKPAIEKALEIWKAKHPDE